MAFNFPQNPSVGQIYTYNGKSFKWNGSTWVELVGPTSLPLYAIVSASPPANPTVGQIWYDTVNDTTKIRVPLPGGGGEWVSVVDCPICPDAPFVPVSISPPVNPNSGQLWFDTLHQVLKVWAVAPGGGSWREAAQCPSCPDIPPVTISSSPPSNPQVGDLWYNPNLVGLSVWYADIDGGQWVSTVPSSINEGGEPGPELSDNDPQPLGSASPGISSLASRDDHVHPMPSALDVGADPEGSALSAVANHEEATDPHPQYLTEDEAVLPDNPALTNSREWIAETVSQPEAEEGTSTVRRAWTAERVWQAIAAWWAASSEKTKLDGIEDGATLNSSDAYLLDRDNHTGTQLASTIGDSTIPGRALLTASTTEEQRTSLELGSAAQADTADFATAAQGSKADTAIQPSTLSNALSTKADLVSGLVPSSQLPSYVDDVLEYSSVSAFPEPGESGKIYISLATGRSYRWSGSIYVEILASPGTTDAVPEGSTNLYFTSARAASASPVQSVAGRVGNVTLGVADVSGAVNTSDSRLSDAREWVAPTVTQIDAESGVGTSRVAWTVERVWQAISAWWAASSAKAKLDGIANGATANSSDSFLLNRSNHTGTQSASTISGLATVATSGLYSDLSGKPGFGTAAYTNSTDYATAAQGTLASTAIQPLALTTALSTKADLVGGVVPSVQLPSYVDDVLEYASLSSFPLTGETGKIYVTLDTNKCYRWSGSTYVEISPSPGSTDSVPEGILNLYFTNTRASSAAPVQSVAGKTGAVSLDVTDVSNAASIGLAAGLSIALG